MVVDEGGVTANNPVVLAISEAVSTAGAKGGRRLQGKSLDRKPWESAASA